MYYNLTAVIQEAAIAFPTRAVLMPPFQFFLTSDVLVCLSSLLFPTVSVAFMLLLSSYLFTLYFTISKTFVWCFRKRSNFCDFLLCFLPPRADLGSGFIASLRV
jgi:hypothetical protein